MPLETAHEHPVRQRDDAVSGEAAAGHDPISSDVSLAQLEQSLVSSENIASLAHMEKRERENYIRNYRVKLGVSEDVCSRIGVLVAEASRPKKRQSPQRRNRRTSGTGFPRSDAGNAELFASMFGDRVRYNHRRGIWLIFDGHWWRTDTDGEVIRLAKEAARARYLAALTHEDEKERKREASFAISSENRSKIDAMLALAKAEHPIADSGEGWDADPYLLGVDNGVLDLRTGKLRTGTPTDRISKHAPTAFDASAKCPTFDAFIKRVVPDRALRQYVQYLAGQTLTADVSGQHLYFWSGSGANGKSTLANALLDVLGPDYARTAPPNLLVTKTHEAHPTEIADLYGARLVFSIEVERGKHLAEMLVKQLTGGDRLKARFMRQDFFEFEPTHKVVLLANDRPTVAGSDYAIWRRIKVIPFDVTIPPAQRDGKLREKLAAERSGILNWMLRGCREWQKKGMPEPTAVAEATEEYRIENDVLGRFVRERCVTGDGLKVAAKSLYEAYANWTGASRMSETEFGTRMAARFEKKRTNAGILYQGVDIVAGPKDVGS